MHVEQKRLVKTTISANWANLLCGKYNVLKLHITVNKKVPKQELLRYLEKYNFLFKCNSRTHYTKMSSEYVSLLIPRTIDNRYLLVNVGGNGLWLPTCEREGEDSLRAVAAKLGEEVNKLFIVYVIPSNNLNMHISWL